MISVRGALAQLVARNVRNVEVRSSNLLCSTSKDLLIASPFLFIRFEEQSIKKGRHMTSLYCIPVSEDFLQDQIDQCGKFHCRCRRRLGDFRMGQRLIEHACRHICDQADAEHLDAAMRCAHGFRNR